MAGVPLVGLTVAAALTPGTICARQSVVRFGPLADCLQDFDRVDLTTLPVVGPSASLIIPTRRDRTFSSRYPFTSRSKDVTYSYNSELVVPGVAGSAGLEVAAAPGDEAQEWSCDGITMSPFATPTFSPTSVPLPADEAVDGSASTSGDLSTLAGGGLTHLVVVGCVLALWAGSPS